MGRINYWHVAIALAIGAFLMHMYRAKTAAKGSAR